MSRASTWYEVPACLFWAWTALQLTVSGYACRVLAKMLCLQPPVSHNTQHDIRNSGPAFDPSRSDDARRAGAGKCVARKTSQ